MKKFIYWNIILLPLFFFGLFKVKADTVPQLVASIENCSLYNSGGSANFNASSGRYVYVYSVTPNVEYTLTFKSGDRLLAFSGTPNDNQFYCNTSNGLGTRQGVFLNYNPVVDNEYSFTPIYDYIYLYFGTPEVGASSSSISWKGSVEPEPEPEPEPLTFDDLIYVPEDSTYNKCYVVQSEGIIRGYDVVPALSTNYNYRDYYINSSYVYKDGNGSWSQYSILPICLDSDVITNDSYYRLDFDKICIIFITLVLFEILLPIKIFSKILFGKAGL